MLARATTPAKQSPLYVLSASPSLADANRSPPCRGSQAGRLADELRLIASGQVSAALALAATGESLVADAAAEKPLPREYTLPPSTRERARRAAGVKSGEEKLPDESDALEEGGSQRPKGPRQGYGVSEKAAGDVGAPAGEPADEEEGTGDIGNDAVGGAMPRVSENFAREGSGLPLASAGAAGAAVEAAAGREEMAAAARIQSFLRRRRRQANLEEVKQVPAVPVSSSAVEPFADDQRSTDSLAEWFGVALRRLRREVDMFLLGDEQQEGRASAVDSQASPVQVAGGQAQELDVNNESAASRVPNADGGGSTDDETAGTHSSSESSGYDSDDDWPTFPPVPLRARAPSLYTLPAPGSSNTGKRKANEVDRADSSAACSIQSTATAVGGGGVFTRLGPEIVARLSSARSVFCLRAADVLAAFSPPPPPRFSSAVGALAAKPRDDSLGPRPSVPEQAVRNGDRSDRPGSGTLSSPNALRHRLRRDAEEASRAGFGRPWLLSSHKRRAPTRHKQEQEQLSAFIREMNSARGGGGGGGGMEKAREKRRRLDFFGSWTPLGRRLAKRYNAGLAARRRRVLGETDQFRARHVGRQLRSGAATSALEGVNRALDLHLRVRREKRVPPAHVTELLDVIDRHVFSDSQV